MIPKQYKAFLDSIRIQEGGKIHRNANEGDITSGAGIYKVNHSQAKIWAYLDEVAKSLGILSNSVKWEKQDLERINAAVQDEKLDELEYDFYKDYLAGAELERFSEVLAPVMADLFTNSPKGSWTSVQYMLEVLRVKGFLKGSSRIIIDGKKGPGTFKALEELKTAPEMVQEIAYAYMLLGMSSFYIDIAIDDMDVYKPGVDKHLRYLNGWSNRLTNLAKA